MRSTVKNLAKFFPTAIISGRSRDKVFKGILYLVASFSPSYIFSLLSDICLCQVYELVGLKELYYAGSHGMDIIGPARQTVCNDHTNCIKSTDEQVSYNKLPSPQSSQKSTQRDADYGQWLTKKD